MKYCLLLLCLFAAQIACSSVAQRKVINNFVKSLDEIDLIDPQWQQTFAIFKKETGAFCVCFRCNFLQKFLPLRIN